MRTDYNTFEFVYWIRSSLFMWNKEIDYHSENAILPERKVLFLKLV